MVIVIMPCAVEYHAVAHNMGLLTAASLADDITADVWLAGGPLPF